MVTLAKNGLKRGYEIAFFMALFLNPLFCILNSFRPDTCGCVRWQF